jgi:hypothetical protein
MTTMPTPPRSPWQAFMRRPEPMNLERHAELTLRDGDFSYAAGAHLVPILVSEIPAAAANHPIVVVTDPAPGLAILVGLEPGRNLLVRDGNWMQGWYIPALMRLYPFAPATSVGGPGSIPLLADFASPQLGIGGAGEPMLDHGRPGREFTERLKLAHLVVQNAEPTRSFAQALIDSGIATPRPPSAPSPSPELDAVPGILRLDARALARLPDQRVLEWHRRGWTAAAVLMLHAERHGALLAALRRGVTPPRRREETPFAPSAIV